MIERAAPPRLGGGPLGRPPVFEQCRLVLAALPAKDAALMDGVQRVDDERGARQVEGGGDGALAKAGQQRRLRLPKQPGLRHPGGKARRLSVVHYSNMVRGGGDRPAKTRRAAEECRSVGRWGLARSADS